MNDIWYTDGACSGNPGPGGFGVVCLNTCYNQTMMEYIPRHTLNYCYAEYSENTTNNREELKAILYVIKMAAANPETDFIVYSDSAYAVNSINTWIHGWAMNNWLNSKKREVENVDLMKEIYSYISKNLFNFQLKKVHGHAGELGNELADALASGNKQKYLNLINKNNVAEEMYLIDLFKQCGGPV